MLLKLKEDTHSITDLEAAHWYNHSLEGTSTLHAKVLQRVFAEFGDSYTLLDVYNIFKKLDLAHAHYEANTIRFPSHSRPQPPLIAPTRSSHSFSKAKAMHFATPMNAIFLSMISFMIIVEKNDIMKLFVLPNSRNGSNFDYHDKIW